MSNIEGFDSIGLAPEIKDIEKNEIATALYGQRKCELCKRTTTTIDKRSGHSNGRWYKYEEGHICHSCYCANVWTPRRKEIRRAKREAKRRGRPVVFNEQVESGVT